ncbi:hypothetical protein BB560_003079 [Smittium megazygosporum]|uniref:TatD related DNase n=1 Tax=Smittium megazygosporum TaxID=133381 RepID=A0A2T9ZCZ9_9FUNG|nr:hypothetical protein BB560_003079 [Smittium megazygosporum]
MNDSHCHFQNCVESLHTTLARGGKEKYIVLGTNYHDWTSVAALAREYPNRVIPGFGIHPWFVNLVIAGEKFYNSKENEAEKVSDHSLDHKMIPPTWLNTLHEYLDEFPTAVVGEFGLDKLAIDKETKQKYNFEKQVELFKTMYSTAITRKRAMSIHCVKAHQQIFDLLQEFDSKALSKEAPFIEPYSQTVKGLALHSYSGSKEVLARILKLPTLKDKVYVGLSAFVNLRSLKKTQLVLPTIPGDKLLLESDLNDSEEAIESMQAILSYVSEVLDIPQNQVVELANENLEKFLSF